MVEKPVVISVRGDVGALVRISPQVENFRNPQVRERVGPNEQCSRGPLLQEHELPVIVAQTNQLLVVVDVKKRLPRALIDLTGQVRHEVVAIEMDLVGHVANFVALEQFVLHLRVTGNRQ